MQREAIMVSEIITQMGIEFSHQAAEHKTPLGDLAPEVGSSVAGRDQIEKQIVTDPHRNVVLQQVQFIAQQGARSEDHLYALLAPHLANQGAGNTAWVDEFEGAPLLFAQRKDTALALACSARLLKRSVGYVGASDGWQDWMQKHTSLRKTSLGGGDLSQISLAVLRIHESKTTPGGLIASLSIPWGFSKGDNDLGGYHRIATYLRELADVWNSSIERWLYASGTDWSRKFNVEGYYVRIAPAVTGGAAARFRGNVQVKNVSDAEGTLEALHLVSPDALALARFGLRGANDPRLRNTAKILDALLKVETPSGPAWHRYNDDGYGEHEDGAPFDGTGIGCGWPLLTGERAHFELAAGRVEDAKRLLATLESFANAGGMISEQVWDSPDIPELELYFGRPSGSAMPLVWAHAEHLKRRRSLQDGRVFDLPPQTVQRDLTEKTVCPRRIWRFNQKIRSMPAGKILRIETMAPAVIHWSADDWKSVQDVTAHDVGLEIYIGDLATAALPEGKQVKFTFYWPDAGHWEDTDFAVRVASSQGGAGRLEI
jgi:GH15 family glucan-1,4-alpha-glucosidase